MMHSHMTINGKAEAVPAIERIYAMCPTMH